MCVYGNVESALRIANVAGDTLVVVEYLHHPLGQPHIDLAPDQAMRDGVEVAVNRDVVVDVDLCRFPFGVFKRGDWQRFERRTFDLLEQLTARLAHMTHGLGVEQLKQPGNLGVKRGQIEELAVA
jgi:hypothetical protein